MNPRPEILPFRRLHVYSCLEAYRALTPPGLGVFSAIQCLFRRQGHRRSLEAIPLVDAQNRSAGVTGKDSSLFMLLQHMHSHLRLYLSSIFFTRRIESSTCSPSLHIPVEPVSPPYFFIFGYNIKTDVRTKKFFYLYVFRNRSISRSDSFFFSVCLLS